METSLQKSPTLPLKECNEGIKTEMIKLGIDETFPKAFAS
jgi:hypothetical protein